MRYNKDYLTYCEFLTDKVYIDVKIEQSGGMNPPLLFVKPVKFYFFVPLK